jgi:hypothetical protein
VILHRVVSTPIRRNRSRAALVVLSALMLQAASAALPAGCSDPTSGSKEHAHVAQVSESGGPSIGDFRTAQSTETETGPCCGPLGPPESDDHETESCTMAMHCVVSVALPAGSSGVVDPAAESGAPSSQCTRPDALVLPHPGPPPRA